MLGIKTVVISHFDWWIYSWLLFITSMIEVITALIGILSFGYLTTNWNIQWLWELETERLEKKRERRKRETRSTNN